MEDLWGFIYLFDDAHSPILSTTSDIQVNTDIFVSHSFASLKSVNNDENVGCT